MRRFVALLLLGASASWAQLPAPGTPGAPDDPRYCGEPERYANGVIKRSAAVRRAFAAVFPCPATLDPTDLLCVGFAMDHTIPRQSGGCDSVANLTWMADQGKSCAAWWCKDRWERAYNAIPRQRIVTP